MYLAPFEISVLGVRIAAQQRLGYREAAVHRIGSLLQEVKGRLGTVKFAHESLWFRGSDNGQVVVFKINARA